jgi:hypothetical protein
MKTSGASRVLKYLELPSFFIPIFWNNRNWPVL